MIKYSQRFKKIERETMQKYLNQILCGDCIEIMHKIPDASVKPAKSSAMIRIHVPKLEMLKGFEFVDKDELNQCFDAIKELTDFANMIETANSITVR